MVRPIPEAVQNVWEKWNIRGIILLSLSLQTFLILFAPLRKRTHKSMALWSIWLAYLLADWAASFCIGLISKISEGKSTKTTPTDNLMAFWAPFLLLHLGGPDTITAFSLEDNELWLRHLLALIFQAVAAAYVFLLTVPENSLWIPTILMFLAGLIKYAERTRALYLASINTFRRSIVRDPDPGPNYAKLMEEQYSRAEAGIPTNIEVTGEPDWKPKAKNYQKTTAINGGSSENQESNVKVVNDAYDFFDKFKGLIVDMIFSFGERNENRDKFLEKSPREALRVIEVELNYIYEVFYTKVMVVRGKAGYFFRFVSFASIVAALCLFIYQDKNIFHKFDVRVTYTLLYGAVALDAIAFLLLIFSDRTVLSSHENEKYLKCRASFEWFLNFRKPKWSKRRKKPYEGYTVLSTRFLSRRWSGTISGHNLITYCLRQCSSENPNLRGIRLLCFKGIKVLKSGFDTVVNYFGARGLLDVWIYKTNNPFLEDLWVFIIKELKYKSENAEDVETTQMICSSRGEWILQEGEVLTGDQSEMIKKLMPFVETDKVTFDESLIMWHIATHLCYVIDDQDKSKEREFSKILSDYMLYLLVMQPTMMSAVAGIGQIRFQDTCAEAKKFFNKRDLEQEGKKKREIEACKVLHDVPTEVKPVYVKGDRSKSLLFDASRLAKELKKLQVNLQWKIISQVWVEMLSFAACNCRPTAFVQQLSKGGELISIVWLLMVHLGLGKQFQIKEGHARAKLIVGK